MVKRSGVGRCTAVSDGLETMVEVVWHDAHAVTETWVGVDDIDDGPCVVRSVGVLVPHAKPGHLVLAQSIIEGDNMVDHVVAIPLGMVRRVHRLSVGVLLPIEPEVE
jgi:hypothetical protein